VSLKLLLRFKELNINYFKSSGAEFIVWTGLLVKVLRYTICSSNLFYESLASDPNLVLLTWDKDILARKIIEILCSFFMQLILIFNLENDLWNLALLRCLGLLCNQN
jgi:hypothetical protein